MINRDEFQKLDPDEQTKIFLQCTLAERGELLLLSHYPEKLTRVLSQEELYLMIHEMDTEERSEIIRYANLPQLLFIADIDCWKNARMNADGFMGWLEILQKAGSDKFLSWLAEVDYEAIVTGFKGIVQVLKPEWEYATDEALGDTPYFTLDDQYYIYVKEENMATVRQAFEMLFERARGRYAAVMEGIIGEMDDILEEEAWRIREIRLSDRGFPDPESARRIYRPITQKEFEDFPLKCPSADKGVDPSAAQRKMPNYLTLWSSEKYFLDEVLLLFREDPPAILQGLHEELVWISNKIIACEGIDFSSEERVRAGIERARHLTSIGLEILSRENILEAKQWMKERWLENIFRLAVTRLLDMRQAAFGLVQHYWDNSRDPFLGFLAEPYDLILRGVLLTIPEYYDTAVADHPYSLRDFRSLKELVRTEQAVQQIQKIHKVLEKKFPKLFAELRSKTGKEGPEIKIVPLLGTLFANFVLQGKNSPVSIAAKDAKLFLVKAFERRGKRGYLVSGLKDKFLENLLTPEERTLLTPLFGVAFQEIEEEMGGLDPDESPNPEFVSSLWIHKTEGAPRKRLFKPKPK